MEKKKKLIILGVIILILAISGITYAILTWTSSKINIGLTSGCFTIDYTKGQDISGNLKLLNESDLISNNKFTIKNGIGISAVNIGIKSTCTIEGYGSIYLNVTNISDAFTTGDSKGALKYAVLSNTSTITTPSSVTVDSLLNQSFDIVSTGSITSSDTITLLTKQLSNTEIYKYLVVIYVDNALAGNSITSASFTGNISADANQGKYVEPTPEYCFNITDKDETNKTASLATAGYNCYTDNDNNYTVVTDVVIPDTIAGYKITKINDNFTCKDYGYVSQAGKEVCKSLINELTSIVIPNSVTTIGNSSFEYNQLTSVNIPDSVTSIGDAAFSYNQLTTVTIPDSVTSIGDAAFSYNQLTTVTIPDSVTTIGKYAFKQNQLTSVTIPSSVTTLAWEIFSENQLVEVILPDSITTIGNYAFSNNQLTSVSIPDSVTTIGNGSFDYNHLTSITIPDSVTTIGNGSFEYNHLTSITIPDSVTKIEPNAFKSNQLTGIIIPDSVTTIGANAFAYNNLSYVLITSDSKLTSIEKKAFSSSNRTETNNSITYVDNPNLKIYNNSGKAFDWNNATYGTSYGTFVTGNTYSYSSGSTTYNAVTVTTGQPS